MGMAIVLSLLTGVTIVLSRTVNARLASESSALYSTLYNYVVGLPVAVLAFFILARGESAGALLAPLSPRLWMYTGGIVGVFSVLLLNATVCKISAFYMTLLLFVGQVFTGVALDFARTGVIRPGTLVGGVAVAAGLILNMVFDQTGKTNNSGADAA